MTLMRNFLFWSFLFLLCFSITIFVNPLINGDPTTIQIASAIAAFLVVLGFSGVFDFLAKNVDYLKKFFFSSRRNLYAFFALYAALIIFFLFASFCLYAKWAHYRNVEALVTRFSETSVQNFMDNLENRAAIHRLATRFPERRDWQVAVDHIVTQTRDNIKDNQTFRTLSLFAVSSVFGVNDITIDTPSDRNLDALKPSNPWCLCTVKSEMDTAPHSLMLKLMAQGFKGQAARRTEIAELWIAHEPNLLPLKVYGSVLELTAHFDDFWTAYEERKATPTPEQFTALRASTDHLEGILTQDANAGFYGSDSYFLARDFLAQAEIYACNRDATLNVPKIARQFQRFLTARTDRLGNDGGVPRWLREPEKSMVYWHVLLASGRASEHNVEGTMEFFNTMCPDYFAKKTDLLSDSFSELTGRDYWKNWRRNTSSVLGSENIEVRLISPSQQIGWRF